MSHFKKRIQLFRSPGFSRYLLSCLFATTGGGLSYIATSWMALGKHNAVGSVAVMMLCFWLPGVILGPFMGVLVDRMPWRHHLLAASNWIRAVVLIIFGYIFECYHSLLGLDLLVFILGTFFSVYIPAAFRLTRELVSKENLLYANATIDTTFEVGNMIGMGSAGLLIAWLGTSGALFTNAVTFILGGIFLLSIKKHHLTVTKDEPRDLNIYADFKDGLNYILTHQAVLIVYTIQLLLFVEYLTAPVLIAPFTRSVLHGNVADFGYIEMSLSIGAIVGGILITWLADYFGLLKTTLISNIILAASFSLFAMNHSIHIAEALYFLIGVCFAAWPLLITRGQHITDINYQGRVQSCFMSISGLILLLVYACVDLADKWVPIRTYYGLEVFFTLISIILILLFIKKGEVDKDKAHF